ncbi:thioredoxin domain-containing protein [Kitasatospora sp. NPDC048545]|uniref:thioredoxin domain-containing protein n=1 Tax=Kitasatospora sp. NPDC048545 TaxID=3157208 RepID=UPI0033D02B2F
MVKAIQSLAGFDAQLASGAYLVVRFTAARNGASGETERFFARCSRGIPSIDFVVVDIDEIPEIGDRYGVQAMPTFAVFKGESNRDAVIGPNRAALRASSESFDRSPGMTVWRMTGGTRWTDLRSVRAWRRSAAQCARRPAACA